jgi:hypothetical protein
MGMCGSCGAAIVAGDAFCTNCGARETVLGMNPADASGNSTHPVAPARQESIGGPPDPPPAASAGLGKLGAAWPSGDVHSPSAGFAETLAADELLGQAAPNTVYLGQRMMYEKELQLEEFDPLRSTRYLFEMFRRWCLIVLMWAAGCIVIFVIGGILSVVASAAGIVIGGLLFVAWSIVLACAYWLMKLPGQLSEWKFSVDDKGDGAPLVFDHIAWALRRRDTPVDSLQLRRFKVMGQGSRDLLEVRQGVFYGLVSCLANGGDLYIGWTFWLYLSPARYLWTGIRRFIWEMRFRGHGIYVSLQFDRAKAFREAIHSAVREGVDVAAGQQIPQGQGTIGSLIPVVADGSLDDEGSGFLQSVSRQGFGQ